MTFKISFCFWDLLVGVLIFCTGNWSRVHLFVFLHLLPHFVVLFVDMLCFSCLTKETDFVYV